MTNERVCTRCDSNDVRISYITETLEAGGKIEIALVLSPVHIASMGFWGKVLERTAIKAEEQLLPY